MSNPAPVRRRIQFHIVMRDANNQVRVLCGQKDASYLVNAKYPLNLESEHLCPVCKPELEKLELEEKHESFTSICADDPQHD